MSLLTAKTEFMKRGAYDELYTPIDAITCLLPFIPPNVKTIWECTSIGGNIDSVLGDMGYSVHGTHISEGIDFFTHQEPCDMIITNPPYSLKDRFLKRAYELQVPFAFLLPLTTLEGRTRGELFHKHGIQIIIPNKRFNFKPNKKGAWFQTSWFTWGLGLGSDISFVKI